ncbi:MAG: potassium channel family protein [Bacteroidota bacterium]
MGIVLIVLNQTQKYLHKNRFDIFLTTQLIVLFSALLFPPKLHDTILQPIFFLLSIAAGINLILSRRQLKWLYAFLFTLSALLLASSLLLPSENEKVVLVRILVNIVFGLSITYHLIQQVWRAELVNRNVIMGLVSGYISLGFLAFFLFLLIDLTHPGAFQGILLETQNFDLKADALMYYSFITLLTIGYGEIVPVHAIAQKAAILTGLAGQFYVIIITTVVLEKYIRHSAK